MGQAHNSGHRLGTCRTLRSRDRLVRFLRRQPGLRDLRIQWAAAETGIRETAVIKGRSSVSVDDYTSGRLFDDAVCYAFYPIDLHVASGTGIRGESLSPGTLPTVPFSAMLPRSIDGLIVAGRCISSDRLANSALRVQATCMAVGQAAGAAAAAAVRSAVPPSDVPLSDIRSVLRRHGAVVPE